MIIKIQCPCLAGELAKLFSAPLAAVGGGAHLDMGLALKSWDSQSHELHQINPGSCPPNRAKIVRSRICDKLSSLLLGLLPCTYWCFLVGIDIFL